MPKADTVRLASSVEAEKFYPPHPPQHPAELLNIGNDAASTCLRPGKTVDEQGTEHAHLHHSSRAEHGASVS